MTRSTNLPVHVGSLPERTPRKSKGFVQKPTLDRLAVIHKVPGDWFAWPTKTSAPTLRKTLNSAITMLGWGGSIEVDARNGVQYVRYVPPALGAGPQEGECPAIITGTTDAVAAIHHVPTTPRIGDVKPAPAPRPSTAVSDARKRADAARISAAAKPRVTFTEHTEGFDGVVTVVEDDNTIHHSDTLAPFRPLGPSIHRDLADAPVSTDAWRPKVKCAGCKTYLVIEAGKDKDSTLAGHYKETPSCKTSQVASRR